LAYAIMIFIGNSAFLPPPQKKNSWSITLHSPYDWRPCLYL